MIFNEIKCHVNTSLGLVEGYIPCIPPCVRACEGANVFISKNRLNKLLVRNLLPVNPTKRILKSW